MNWWKHWWEPIWSCCVRLRRSSFSKKSRLRSFKNNEFSWSFKMRIIVGNYVRANDHIIDLHIDRLFLHLLFQQLNGSLLRHVVSKKVTIFFLKIKNERIEYGSDHEIPSVLKYLFRAMHAALWAVARLIGPEINNKNNTWYF